MGTDFNARQFTLTLCSRSSSTGLATFRIAHPQRPGGIFIFSETPLFVSNFTQKYIYKHFATCTGRAHLPTPLQLLDISTPNIG
jgi:hypothetical protein